MSSSPLPHPKLRLKLSVDELRLPAREVDEVDAEVRGPAGLVLLHVVVHDHVALAHGVVEEALPTRRVDVVVRAEDVPARVRALRDRVPGAVEERARGALRAPDAHLVLFPWGWARLVLYIARAMLGPRKMKRAERGRDGGGTYASEGCAAVREELEPVGRAWGLVGEAALGGTTVAACEVRAREVLRLRGDVLELDLEDAARPRAEAELELPVVHDDIPVDCVHAPNSMSDTENKDDGERAEHGGDGGAKGRKGRRTGIVSVTLLRPDHRAVVLPRTRLHRRTRGDTDRRVLRPELRDGVV